MRWWPVVATVSACLFALALGAFALAPVVERSCAVYAEPAACGSFGHAARSLVVVAGALFAGSLVGGVHMSLLTRRNARGDTRPLVSVHARRRP